MTVLQDLLKQTRSIVNQELKKRPNYDTTIRCAAYEGVVITFLFNNNVVDLNNIVDVARISLHNRSKNSGVIKLFPLKWASLLYLDDIHYHNVFDIYLFIKKTNSLLSSFYIDSATISFSMDQHTTHIAGYAEASALVRNREKSRHHMPDVERNQVKSLFNTVGEPASRITDIVMNVILEYFKKDVEPVLFIPNLSRTYALFVVTEVERRLMVKRRRESIPLQVLWWYRTPSSNKGPCYIAVGYVGLEYLVNGDVPT